MSNSYRVTDNTAVFSWARFLASQRRSCLKRFESMFGPDSNRENDIIFCADANEISLYSMLEQIVSNKQKIDDIWFYSILQLLNHQLPSDISITIVQYLN
jgi:hypothetical protein